MRYEYFLSKPSSKQVFLLHALAQAMLVQAVTNYLKIVLKGTSLFATFNYVKLAQNKLSHPPFLCLKLIKKHYFLYRFNGNWGTTKNTTSLNSIPHFSLKCQQVSQFIFFYLKECYEKIYLHTVLDIFNNEILNYSISTIPNFWQTKEMLKSLLKDYLEQQSLYSTLTKVGNTK